ncbi:hypothetical protein D6779_12145 [Candidatus Parcubacteria bacterium]|nr:MAG: hypothetical protein D6779_12145 [Candidatus Parcubacteria bacterium]
MRLSKEKFIGIFREGVIKVIVPVTITVAGLWRAPLAYGLLAVRNDAPQLKVRDWKGIETMLCNFADTMAVLFFVVAVVFTLVAAYQYLVSGGDTEKVKKASKTLTYTAVAVVVALLAFAFPRIVFSIFGGGRMNDACAS